MRLEPQPELLPRVAEQLFAKIGVGDSDEVAGTLHDRAPAQPDDPELRHNVVHVRAGRHDTGALGEHRDDA